MDQTVPVPQSDPSSEAKFQLTPVMIIIAVVVVLVGILAGFLASRPASKKNSAQTTLTGQTANTANVIGSTDTKTFSDVATGKLDKGGIKGEGTHHLIRPGGDSQTVYLISSVVDLDQFVGKQIELNGQTLKGRYAGWLMDVGRVKILE